MAKKVARPQLADHTIIPYPKLICPFDDLLTKLKAQQVVIPWPYSRCEKRLEGAAALKKAALKKAAPDR